ncbi:MAG: acyltransferase family protein, partial [Alloprevotella sp.]
MTISSPKPPRASNFELLRLVAMAMVLVLHANFYSLGEPTHTLFSRDPWAFGGRVFWEFLALPAVNLFVLISGWFGIRPSWRGALNLLFTVFFFSALAGIVLTACGETFAVADFLKSLYPCGGLWFIQSYLLLFVLSPVLNAFIASADRQTLKRLLLAFFALAFLLGWMRNIPDFNNGYSVVWFMALYLFARYMRLHRPAFTRLPRRACLSAFFVFTLFNCGLYCLTKLPDTAGAMKALGIQTLAYESPFTFLAAVSLFLFFEKCHFTSRLVNVLAASSLSIYVIHKNPLVFPYFKDVCVQIFGDFDGIAVLAVMACFLFAV